MLKHHLIFFFRNIKRQKSSFFINLTGLSTGLACALLIYLWVNDELSVDKFHEMDDRLYQVMRHRVQDGEITTSTWVPGLTAQTLEEEMPEVEHAVPTFNRKRYTLSVDNNDMKATGQYVGEDFFSMFTYPLIHGDASRVLTDRSSIVISESLALNLFNTTENVVGKTIEWEHDEQYQVTGIFEDIPHYSSVQFDFVLPFKIYQDDACASRWQTSCPETYALLKPGADVDQLNEKIADLIEKKTNGEMAHWSLFAAPYSDTYLYGNYENGQQAGGRIEYVRLFSVIAIFILIIACINFMNLSTSKASKRMKEVGVKKAVGAGRESLIVQYLSESILMAFISMFLAVLIVELFLPQFNTITGKQLALAWNNNLILSLFSVTFITGLIAGSYPAFYLSGIRPSTVLKGKLMTSLGELWVRKGLVIFQFTLSIILIVSVFAVYKQIEFVQNKHLGYEKDNVLYFSREGSHETLETFLSEIREQPGVLGASSIGHDMTGHIANTAGVHWPGKASNDVSVFEMMPISYDMLEVLEIEMKEGRRFSRDFATDTEKIIFNEAAIERMGISDPIGKTVRLFEEEREIIGVVKDFHFESLHEEVKPAVLWLAPWRTSNIAVKIEAGRERETIDQLQSLFQEFYPGFPFDYQFLDQEYQQQYIAEQRVSTVSQYFAGIAILISCLGLFGLAAFTAERRQKEIGIRKVLGATMSNIVTLLSKDFLILVLLGFVFAVPIAWYLMNQWLADFAYRIEMGPGIFAIAGGAALLIALATVSWQSVKAALMNPVNSLRSE